MATEVTWIAHTGVSALHGADAVARGGPLVDQALADQLAESVQALAQAIKSAEIKTQSFFDWATIWAYHETSERRIVERTLQKMVGPLSPPELVADFSNALTQIKRITLAAQPQLLDQLTLRSKPLRDQWDTFGPGLLAMLARLTEPALLVDSAFVFVVYPIAGGGGFSLPPLNSVRIEGVLTNPCAELPEVVRLSWLIATLNNDLPRFHERLTSPRRTLVPSLALVPATLAAAVELELVRLTPDLLSMAIELWLGTAAQNEFASTSLAPIVDRWWQTYRALRPEWSMALMALDELLAEV